MVHFNTGEVMKNKIPNYSIFASALLLAFVSIGCMDGIDTDPKNLIGRWQMSKVIHQGNAISKPDLPAYYNEVEIEFLTQGAVKGALPTEEFSGDYKVPGEDSISVTCWKSSKKGIPEWGEYFFYHINLVTTFSLKKSGLDFKYKELYLNYSDGQLIFKRVD
jgi:hypothetical protein